MSAYLSIHECLCFKRQLSEVEAAREGGGARRERERVGGGGVGVGGVRQREEEIVENLPPVSRGTKRNTRFLFIYFDRCGSLAQLPYGSILSDTQVLYTACSNR